jgi:hypothetical protein
MCFRSQQTEMFRFETANFTVIATILEDNDADLSFDETDETRDNINSGEWQCFGTIVTVYHKGIELGSDSLWGSIYANPADFFKEHVGLAAKSRADGRNYGSYFPGMVREAIAEARKALASMPKLRAA